MYNKFQLRVRIRSIGAILWLHIENFVSNLMPQAVKISSPNCDEGFHPSSRHIGHQSLPKVQEVWSITCNSKPVISPQIETERKWYVAKKTMRVQKGPKRSHVQHFRDQLIHQIDWERFLYIRGKWNMIAYSLTSILCIFELLCFLTSAPLSVQLIRVSMWHFGRPFKLLIQSFNLYCSAYHLLKGFATLSVLLHVYVVKCSDVYMAIDWLIFGV